MVSGFSSTLCGPRDWELTYYYKCLSELQQTQGTVLCLRRKKVSLIKMRSVSGCKQTDFIFTETNLEDIVAQVEALENRPCHYRLDLTMTSASKWSCRKCVSCL